MKIARINSDNESFHVNDGLSQYEDWTFLLSSPEPELEDIIISGLQGQNINIPQSKH